MKNSTLIRIKVPKALYESALRKALLEAEDKEHKGGHKGKKYTKEDDYDKEEKTPKAGKGYADKEPTKTGKAHKGKAFVKDDAYTDKVSTKKSLGETKKKKIKESEDEFGDAYPQPNSPNTGGSRTASLYPNRDVYKDTYRLSEKKKKMEEATDVANLGIIAYGLATFLGLSTMIVKNMFKYMKENNLTGIKGFIKAYNVVGGEASSTINKAKGINEAVDFANLGIIAYGLATFLGVSSVIVKNIFKYMKENNLKGMKGFIKAYDVVGSQAAATIN